MFTFMCWYRRCRSVSASIRFACSIQYIKMHLDIKRGFGPHCREVKMTVMVVSAAVFCLLTNAAYQLAAKRRLLTTVVYTKMLYAAEVQAHTVTSAKRKKAFLQHITHRASPMNFGAIFARVLWLPSGGLSRVR